MPSNAQRDLPEIEVFNIDDRKARRLGKYLPVYKKLVELAETKQGLVIKFKTKPTGHSAIQVMATWAGEDNFDLYSELTESFATSRRVWLERKTDDKK